MTFLRNVWADMVEKRLWPLAVAMLVGIVAVPTVLAKKNSEHDTQQVVATVAANHAANANAEAAVALDTSAAATARRNHLGRQRNPFDQLFAGAPAARPRPSSRRRRRRPTASPCTSARPARCTPSATSRA